MGLVEVWEGKWRILEWVKYWYGEVEGVRRMDVV